MALAQADLDALDAAIAKGVLTVEYDGRRVTYQSTDQLLKARALVQAQVAGTAAVTHSFAAFSKD